MTFKTPLATALVSALPCLFFPVQQGHAQLAPVHVRNGTLSAAQFPSVTSSYLDARTINPQSFSYQMADYDTVRNQVIFYPYGSVTAPIANSGVVLFYNVGSNAFTNPASWSTVDLSVVATPNAVNFGGGFLDDLDSFAFLPPGSKGYTGTPAQTALAHTAVSVRIDLAKERANPNDPSAYEWIDLRTLPGIQNVGGFSGVYAAGYAYFAPTIDCSNGNYHGTLIRYNSAQPFSNKSAWQYFNLNNIVSPADPELGGMQSMAYIAPYVYLIPFQYGASGNVKQASKIVRYDTTKNFQSASSYEFFDLSTLPVPAALKAQMGGFTGGIVVGQSLLLVPWGSRGNQQTNHVAVIYDTTRALNDPTAWQYIDLYTINAAAGGYQFGWVDKNGFVSLVPTHNYNLPLPSIPPFITWNSNLPFTSVSSWETHPNTTGAWSTGVAYDPGTNTAWFAPYGAPSGNYVPLITQLGEQ
jgi:hypothetical protein